MKELVDLGQGVQMMFFGWQDVEKAGVITWHKTGRGKRCGACVLFDLPSLAEAIPAARRHEVESMEPLSLKAAIVCPTCGQRGFIREGQWQAA